MGVRDNSSRRTYGNIIKFFDSWPLIGVASWCSSTWPSAAGRTLVHSVGRDGCKRHKKTKRKVWCATAKNQNKLTDTLLYSPEIPND